MTSKQLHHALYYLCVVSAALGMEMSQQSIDEGKQQYELLSQKAQIPNFGECWIAALKELRRDCRHLDDVTQARLALRFASCFLQTSGLQPISCDETDDVRPCLRRLNDRQFDSYREFFTHTQNMCSFLQVQVWHQQTGRLISRLGSEAAAVAERLEQSGSVQQDIMQAQQLALGNQQQLMEQGRRMSHDVDNWRQNLQLMAQDFREQTAEHRDLILTVFERLTSLQQLVLDRFSWFNSLAHYVAGVLLVYLLTSTARTAGARLWLFLLLTSNLALERLLAAYFISAASPLHSNNAQQTGALLDSSVWLLRRAAVSLCLLILAVTVYRYRDLNVANNQLLLELHRQHRDLRAYIAVKGGGVAGVSMVGDRTDGGATGASLFAGLRSGHTRWPRRALSSVAADLRPRPGSGLGDLARTGSARWRPAWHGVSAGGDVPDGGLTDPAQYDLPPPEEEEEEEVSDSVSVASDVSACRVLVLSSNTGSTSRHRRPSLMDVLSSSEERTAAVVRSSPVETVRAIRCRSGTPQPSPGRYNLRERPSAGGERTQSLQSPASLSHAVHRMEALTDQQGRLVRRALRR